MAHALELLQSFQANEVFAISFRFFLMFPKGFPQPNTIQADDVEEAFSCQC